LGGIGPLALQHLGRGAVVADVGHAGADEHLICWFARDLAKQLSDEILILSICLHFPELEELRSDTINFHHVDIR
jgi:hypothetical protein